MRSRHGWDQPRARGRRLRKRFGQANSDWERLTRTEFTSAGERAKLEEWKKRKIKGAEDAPVAGYDTYPRCRCANTFEHDEDGKPYVAFSPARNACEICMALTG